MSSYVHVIDLQKLGRPNRARTGRCFQSVYDGASWADLGVVPRDRGHPFHPFLNFLDPPWSLLWPSQPTTREVLT